MFKNDDPKPETKINTSNPGVERPASVKKWPSDPIRCKFNEIHLATGKKHQETRQHQTGRHPPKGKRQQKALSSHRGSRPVPSFTNIKMTSISLHLQKRWMSPHLHRRPHPCPCKRHNPWCHQWSSNPVQWIIISHRNIETRCFRSLFFALLLGTWEVWPWQHGYKLMVLSSDLEDSTLKTLLTLSPRHDGHGIPGHQKTLKKQSAKPINLHKMPARREQGGVKVEGRF